MQFTGSLLVVLLLPVVPRHEAAAAAAATAAAVAIAAPPGDSAPRSPTRLPALQRSGSRSSGCSTAAGEERAVPVQWDATRHAQRLSIDGEAEVALSFSSSFSGR